MQERPFLISPRPLASLQNLEIQKKKMSSCLSGGGGGRAAAAAAYRLESLDLEMIKSPPSTTSWISSSSSPSSTLSESSTLAISTRKPRTPRKRPNQIYNEAAALLSTAYPKLFPPNHAAAAATGNTAATFNKSEFSFEPSDLLIPLRPIEASAGFLPRRTNWAGSNGPGPFERAGRSPSDDGDLDFDVGSIILDEEVMGEGIDCVMGDFSADRDNDGGGDYGEELRGDFCYGYPMGLGFETGEIGMRKEARGVRDGDGGGDWWRIPSVAAVDSSQRAAKGEKRKKKKKKVSEIRDSETKKEDSGAAAGTMLKLDYDGVLEAWSDKASPFAGESEVAGRDVQGRLAQIDLFGGGREASMLRYREKRRNRLFSKKIIYQVRKVNADRRPRMKGRFVRTRDSSDD